MRPLAPRLADALVAAAMVAVPLASSSAFVDQYTTVKWYVVHALAAAWLLVEVWGPGYAEHFQVLRAHIANLRRKIEPADGPLFIRTDPGVGYRFAA